MFLNLRPLGPLIRSLGSRRVRSPEAVVGMVTSLRIVQRTHRQGQAGLLLALVAI